MIKNVGSIDKVIRIVVGLAAIALGIIYQSWWGAIGLVPLLTGLSNTCPAYMTCGVNTNKPKN